MAFGPICLYNFTSKTNSKTAPAGCENAFLIPIATNLKDTPKIRDKYFNKVITKLRLLRVKI